MKITLHKPEGIEIIETDDYTQEQLEARGLGGVKEQEVVNETNELNPELLETIVLVVLDEINILREKAGLAVRTKKQTMTALKNKLKEVEGHYQWVGELIDSLKG